MSGRRTQVNSVLYLSPMSPKQGSLATELSYLSLLIFASGMSGNWAQAQGGVL
jgi:hypothetical protein